jgi:nucleotide-binding universal stress UspA family protein
MEVVVVAGILVAWVTVGVLVSFAMGRRGHDVASWGALGMLLGPLLIPLAVREMRRERAARAITIEAGGAGRGEIDVLVGIDGSPESLEALWAAVHIIGPRVGRLTLATVIDYDAALSDQPWSVREGAEAELRRVAAMVAGHRPGVVLLAGRPAEALARYAREGGYELIAVGSRGRGVSKAILGSVASQLARGAGVPVLVVQTASRAWPAGSRGPEPARRQEMEPD